MIERPSTKSPKGIAVLSPDPNNPLPSAAALIRALKAADIPFDLMVGSDLSAGTVSAETISAGFTEHCASSRERRRLIADLGF